MTRKDEKVVIGYCHPGHIHAGFHESLLDLLVFDTAFDQRIVRGGGRLAVQASANLAGPRNEIVKQFLDYDKADWLWFVDTDMVFQPNTLERLLEHADPVTAPIVGGLCFSTNQGRIFPTLYGLMGEEDDVQVIRYHEWPPDSMFQVAATGTGCLLIHKTVLQRMRDFVSPSGQKGFNKAFPWFQETTHDNRPVSEDITFCWRAGLLEIPVFVNTAVHIGHVKEQQLTLDLYLEQISETEARKWSKSKRRPE